MSNYTKTVDFNAKDTMITGNPSKVVKGSEIDTEFNNIATAVATKYDSSSTIPIANGGTGASTLAGAGIVTTTGTQSIGGTKTFTGLTNFTTATSGASFGQATPNGNYAAHFQPNATSGIGGAITQNQGIYLGLLCNTQDVSVPMIGFFYGAIGSGLGVGSITTNGTVTAYVTTSDYRLKENITPLTNAVTRIKQLAPKNFTWKNNPSLGTTEGFIAHELDAVVPDAVFGAKDAVDQDGKPIHQGVDNSFLVPILTAALQEALTRIEALEAKVG